MMTFSLRFGGGIGRSVAVVLFDISPSRFFCGVVFALFVLIRPLLRGDGVPGAWETMRKRVFFLSLFVLTFIRVLFFLICHKWDIDRGGWG